MSFIVKEAKKANIPLSLCGELASDPYLLPYFIGLGVEEISVTPRSSISLKRILSSFTVEEAQIPEDILEDLETNPGLQFHAYPAWAAQVRNDVEVS